jgi:diguanylate cyclase (GGDEF)-like protein
MFCVWSIRLFLEGSLDQQRLAVLFGTLTAMGCAYGLSSFPSAARIPLALIALPIALLLIVTGSLYHIAVGLSLGSVTLLILRLVTLHNIGFTRLVESRSQIAVERARARQAEALAVHEKARANAVAETDHLTGLPNRRSIMAALDALRDVGGSEKGQFALALLDLDGFKPINDTYGHSTGDTVLCEVGSRLQAAVGRMAVVGRMGGDEFAMLLSVCDDAEMAMGMADRACAALQCPFVVGGRRFRLSACCGVAMLEDSADALRALMAADTALYAAKADGRGKVALFSPAMEQKHSRRAAIEAALREEATYGNIRLFYQPIFDLQSGALRSFEALARWTCPILGDVSPGEFIPIAEQSGAIAELGEKLFVQAIAEAKTWPDSICLSFNLSAVQLCSLDSSEKLLAALRDHGMDPRRLKIEVTETALLMDFELARANLDVLRREGVRVVLDDFGAGHASIAYLREIRFDAIKLDGSLLASVAVSRSGQQLLKGVLDLCASLGTSCVAECIETKDQLELLRQLNCRAGQGFLLGKPLPPADARAFAASRIVEHGRPPSAVAGSVGATEKVA